MFELMKKAKAGLEVFRVGCEIANAGKWKAGQISGTLLAGFILAMVNLAAALGHPLPVDADTANAIGAGVIAVVNVVLASVTSARAGLLPAAAGQSAGQGGASQPGGVPGVAALAQGAGGDVQLGAQSDLQDGAAASVGAGAAAGHADGGGEPARQYTYISGEQYEFHG
jgi:hypothetical protein